MVITSSILNACENTETQKNKKMNIAFLHHSTGGIIFNGNSNAETGLKIDIPTWIQDYNTKHGTSYSITENAFPKSKPYGWNNYPYDYYNIWVKNGGEEPYKEEPTLEILTKEFNMIIFKHCFPVSYVVEDSGQADINSEVRSFENYELQYEALKKKMHRFPETKFLVWTGAALVKEKTSRETALRAKKFFNWVKDSWDEEGDNIFLWDFYELETEGGLYLKPEYQAGPNDSHPTVGFAEKMIPLFGQRIVDVIENNGNKTNLVGIKDY